MGEGRKPASDSDFVEIDMNGNKENIIRAILFDFGGVIAEEGFNEGLKAIAKCQGLEPDKLPHQGMEAVYDSGYVTGKGSEKAFWELLRQRTGIRGDDAVLREEILSRFVVRPWMIDLVEELRRRGYLTAILSDQTDWLGRLDADQGFLKKFDRLFVSYRLGKGKRDPTLFSEVVKSLALKPEQVIFIDDAPGNIERARSCGLGVLLFTDREAVETRLRAMLE